MRLPPINGEKILRRVRKKMIATAIETRLNGTRTTKHNRKRVLMKKMRIRVVLIRKTVIRMILTRKTAIMKMMKTEKAEEALHQVAGEVAHHKKKKKNKNKKRTITGMRLEIS